MDEPSGNPEYTHGIPSSVCDLDFDVVVKPTESWTDALVNSAKLLREKARRQINQFSILAGMAGVKGKKGDIVSNQQGKLV